FTDIHPPVEDSVLGYLDVADLCGRVRLLMFLYDDTDSVLTGIRWKDVYIGDLIYAEDSTANTPFFRAEALFPRGAFDSDTVVRISLVSYDYAEDRLEGDMFYAGDYFSPLLHLQPEGARFEPGERPVIYYYLTSAEVEHYGISQNNVHLYAVSTNGFFREITTNVMVDSNGVMIIQSEPDSFPGGSQEEGEYVFFTPFPRSATVTYKVRVEAPSKVCGDKVMVKVVVPEAPETIGVIRGYVTSGGGVEEEEEFFFKASADDKENGGEPVTIYDALELHRRSSSALPKISRSPWERWVVDTCYYYILSDTVEWIEIPLMSGTNRFWVGDAEAMKFGFEGDASVKVRNCPVTSFTVVRDTAGPRIVFVTDPDPLLSYWDDEDTVGFYMNEAGRLYYMRYDLSGNLVEDRTFEVEPYETVYVTWNGRLYGDFAPEGDYPYLVFGVDDAGNRSKEHCHAWRVHFRVPVEIVFPSDGIWLRDTVTLVSSSPYSYRVEWLWNDVYIGMEDSAGAGLVWNTEGLPDMKDVEIVARCEDAFGYEGADTVRVGIDNHPPVSSLDFSEPYVDRAAYTSVGWGTEISIIAQDTFSGIASVKYRVIPSLTLTKGHPSDDGEGDTYPWKSYTGPFTMKFKEEGYYTVEFYSVDKVGNAEDVKRHTLYVDTGGPSVSIVYGEPAVVTDTVIYIAPWTPITFNAYDPSGVREIKYRVYLRVDSVWMEDVPWTLAPDTLYLSYPEGSRMRLEVQGWDSLGNWSRIIRGEFAIESEPPTTYLFLGVPRYERDGMIYITSSTPCSLYAEDEISGVKETHYAVDDTLSFLIYTAPFTVSGPDGEHVIYRRSVDVIGNVEAWKDTVIFLDNAPPQSRVKTRGPRYEDYITSATEILILSLDMGSGVDRVFYAVDDGEFVEYSVPFTLPEGIHKVSFYAVDNLGNTEDVKQVVFRVDNTSPVAHLYLTEPQWDSLYVSSLTEIFIKAEDPEVLGVASGVWKVYYRIDGGLWRETEADVTSFHLEGPDGMHTIDY
ncbi:hypothetical protein DRO29_04840, partial [Candidatus Bathyarchaeota archaeon]